MKIDTRSPREIGGAYGTQRMAAAGAARDASSSASANGARDMTSVMGIPETEFTPKVKQAIMALMAEVDALRRDLQVAQTRIKNLEQTNDQDTLTPIANRRAFVRELSRMMSFSDRYGTPSAVLYFDVDGLKEINDTLGHAAGDAALLQVARILADNVRDTDTTGRLGGDEFGMILANADEAEAAEKAESLARAIERTPLVWKGRTMPLSVSWGSYSFRSVVDPLQAIEEADREMYQRRRAARA
ncbi:MAG: GGDEF domain-containing protein [Rhodospirillales bacterium]|jgi:diguanylate cyclase (GGDEF)-like protein